MRRYAGFAGLDPSHFRAPALTIGVFDGVHRGHAALLAELRSWASDDAGESVVLTFDRHPRAVLRDRPPAMITSVEHRLRLFARAGIDAAVVLPFDERRAETSAEAFLAELDAAVRPRKILLGANHRFGRGREGDAAFARRFEDRYGFTVRTFQLEGDGRPISSTRIRELVRSGELDAAAELLGRPVSTYGEVVSGEQRGRGLGFPTANLAPSASLIPPRGVYAAAVRISDDESRRLAVVNIGARPTFRDDDGQDRVEVHLLRFEGDLYGRALEVDFLSRLRAEQRFSGVAELKARIAADIAEALARHGAEYFPASSN